MALNANKVDGGGSGSRVKQPLIETGGYPGRVVQIIDFGLQPQRPFEGKEKPPCNEIYIGYEFSDEFMVDEKGEEIPDKPRWIGETLPFRNLKADKAKSTQRYKAIDPKDSVNGEFTKLAGMPCIINVVENPDRKGKKDDEGNLIIYTNVESLGAMREKDAKKLPELVNDPVIFVIDEPDMEMWERLPEWMQDKIKANLQFKGSKLQAILDGVEPSEGGDENDEQEDEPEVPVQMKDDVEEDDWDDDDE